VAIAPCQHPRCALTSAAAGTVVREEVVAAGGAAADAPLQYFLNIYEVSVRILQGYCLQLLFTMLGDR
jgi:hypothetical protein